jgi:hypothetical protein
MWEFLFKIRWLITKFSSEMCCSLVVYTFIGASKECITSFLGVILVILSSMWLNLCIRLILQYYLIIIIIILSMKDEACFLFLGPQNEVVPSISSSVVLCSFVLLVYIVVLVLVVYLCPSSVRVVATFSGTVLFPLLCSVLKWKKQYYLILRNRIWAISERLLLCSLHDNSGTRSVFLSFYLTSRTGVGLKERFKIYRHVSLLQNLF